MSFDIGALAEMFSMVRNGVGAIKDLMSLVPSGQRKAAEETLEKADIAFRTAEAKVAKEIGYELCKCAWPPHIMTRTSVGRMLGSGADKYRHETWQCPNCGNSVIVTTNASHP